jgi:hypothetical protein
MNTHELLLRTLVSKSERLAGEREISSNEKILASQGIMDAHKLLSDTLSPKREQLTIERETKPHIRSHRKSSVKKHGHTA